MMTFLSLSALFGDRSWLSSGTGSTKHTRGRRMAEETRKKAKSVMITWEDGNEEVLACGEAGDVFVVLASEEVDRYTSMWSGGNVLFQAVMVSAIEFRARLHALRIHDEDRQTVDRFIEDALGGEE